MSIFFKKTYLGFLITCSIFTATNAFCLEDLFSFKRQDLEFKIYKENSNILIKVTNKKIATIEKFSLQNPARIVIDITGLHIKKSENIGINNVPLIKTIRLGGHPPYQTRLVIDLKNEMIPSYTTFLKNGELTVLLANSENELQNIKVSVDALNKPNIVKVDRIEKNFQNTIPQIHSKTQIIPPTKEAVINNNQPSSNSMMVLQKEKLSRENNKVNIANDDNCILSSIFFDNDVTGSSIAKISLNQKVNFSIKKASDELYKVYIPNCKLVSKNLEHPFFPLPEFKKFIFIQAKEIGENIEVSVGIETNTTLNYLQRENEIWVKPSL